MDLLIQLLTTISDIVVFKWLGWAETELYAKALHYFIIAFSEIMILLLIVTLIMGIVQHYLSFEKIRDLVGKKSKYAISNIIASIFGAITPFCSCSSTPIFIGMMQAKIPLGIALSFLITSPLINELAIAMFWVIFGWKITLIYISTGIILGVLGGLLLEKLGMSKHIALWIQELNEETVRPNELRRPSLLNSFPKIFKQTIATVKKLLPYILVGISIGSFIHGYVPTEFFKEYIGQNNWYTVPISVIIAIPLYIDAAGILPIIESFVAKGVPIGTAIAFMMGSIGLSLPEALLLKKVMQKKLIIAYFLTIGIGMILAGYFYNYLFS